MEVVGGWVWLRREERRSEEERDFRERERQEVSRAEVRKGDGGRMGEVGVREEELGEEEEEDEGVARFDSLIKRSCMSLSSLRILRL